MKNARRGVAGLLLAMALVGCGGDGDDSAEVVSTTTEATATTARPSTTEVPTTTERPTTTTTTTTAPTTTTTEALTTTTTTEPPTTTTTRPDAGPNGEYVLAEDYGDEWPLTVDGGALRCEGSSAVTFETDGNTYAINGTARGQAQAEGWSDIFESTIWADDPTIPGVKKNIGPLIGDGLELC